MAYQEIANIRVQLATIPTELTATSNELFLLKQAWTQSFNASAYRECSLIIAGPSQINQYSWTQEKRIALTFTKNIKQVQGKTQYYTVLKQENNIEFIFSTDKWVEKSTLP